LLVVLLRHKIWTGVWKCEKIQRRTSNPDISRFKTED